VPIAILSGYGTQSLSFYIIEHKRTYNKGASSGLNGVNPRRKSRDVFDSPRGTGELQEALLSGVRWNPVRE
jgi:hypothetical protein